MDAVVAGADRPGDDNARVLAALRRSFLLQLLILALALIATTTVIGLVSLWPDGSRRAGPQPPADARETRATARRPSAPPSTPSDASTVTRPSASSAHA